MNFRSKVCFKFKYILVYQSKDMNIIIKTIDTMNLIDRM